MKQKTKANRVSKGKKREWMVNVGLIAYMAVLVLRIPLGRMIGDNGIGFYAGVMEMYMVIQVVFSYGLSKALAALIRYRVRREMFRSAKRVYRDVMLFTIIAGVLLMAGMVVFSGFISGTLLLEPKGYLAVAAVAPAVFLSAVMGMMRGYFQGMGTMVPAVHSRLVEKVIQFGASLLLGSAFYSYGEKVAALLKTPEFAAAYGAAGAALGLSVACFFGLLHMIFIRMVYAKPFRRQLERDNTKYAESNVQIFLMFFQTALPYMLCALLYNMNYLVDQRIFNYAMNVQEKGGLKTEHWGVYYGKYSVVIGLAATLCAYVAAMGIPRVIQLKEKQEHREAQFRFGNLVHYLAIITIPCAVMLAVLAEPVVGILFTGDRETAVSLIQAGSVVVILFPFGYLFMSILQRTRNQKFVVFGGLAAFMLHLLLVFILASGAKIGIFAVVCGMIMFWLAVCVAGFIGIMRYLSYTPDWIRFFAVPAGCAGIAGLVVMLLCRVLLGLLGNVMTLILCVIVGMLIYNVLLVLLKGVKEEELRDMPGGGILLLLWERVHLI